MSIDNIYKILIEKPENWKRGNIFHLINDIDFDSKLDLFCRAYLDKDNNYNKIQIYITKRNHMTSVEFNKGESTFESAKIFYDEYLKYWPNL